MPGLSNIFVFPFVCCDSILCVCVGVCHAFFLPFKLRQIALACVWLNCYDNLFVFLNWKRRQSVPHFLSSEWFFCIFISEEFPTISRAVDAVHYYRLPSHCSNCISDIINGEYSVHFIVSWFIVALKTFWRINLRSVDSIRVCSLWEQRQKVNKI